MEESNTYKEMKNNINNSSTSSEPLDYSKNNNIETNNSNSENIPYINNTNFFDYQKYKDNFYTFQEFQYPRHNINLHKVNIPHYSIYDYSNTYLSLNESSKNNLLVEVKELKNEYNKLKNELNRAKNENEVGNKYIKLLEKNIVNKYIKDYQTGYNYNTYRDIHNRNIGALNSFSEKFVNNDKDIDINKNINKNNTLKFYNVNNINEREIMNYDKDEKIFNKNNYKDDNEILNKYELNLLSNDKFNSTYNQNIFFNKEKYFDYQKSNTINAEIDKNFFNRKHNFNYDDYKNRFKNQKNDILLNNKIYKKSDINIDNNFEVKYNNKNYLKLYNNFNDKMEDNKDNISQKRFNDNKDNFIDNNIKINNNDIRESNYKIDNNIENEVNDTNKNLDNIESSNNNGNIINEQENLNNNINNDEEVENILNEKYLIIDENGNPIIFGGQKLFGMKFIPLLGEDGKEELDEDGNILFIGPDGEPKSLSELEPILLDNDKPLVNEQNKPFLGLCGIPLINNEGCAIIGPGELYDSNENKVIGILGFVQKDNCGNPFKDNTKKDKNENIINRDNYLNKEKFDINATNNININNYEKINLYDIKSKERNKKNSKDLYGKNNKKNNMREIEENNFNKNYKQMSDVEKSSNQKTNSETIKNCSNKQYLKQKFIKNNKRRKGKLNYSECTDNSLKKIKYYDENEYKSTCFACQVGCSISKSGYSKMNYSPYNNHIKRREITPIKY